MDPLNIARKRSKYTLPNTEYGLTANEVNDIISKINEMVALVDTLATPETLLDKKVGVDEIQNFTNGEKIQARANIGAPAIIKLTAENPISSVDNFQTPGFYECKLLEPLNGTSNLKLIVFGSFAEIKKLSQIQFVSENVVDDMGEVIYMRHLMYSSVWSNWVKVGDNLTRYLSISSTNWPTSYKESLRVNLGIFSEASGATFMGMANPTTVPTSNYECFYLTTDTGTFTNFGTPALTITSPGLYMLKNSYNKVQNSDGTISTGLAGGRWSARMLMPSMVNLTVASARTLVATNGLFPGRLYKITDHPNDNGIILQAATTNAFFSDGVRIGRVPNSYIPGTYYKSSGTPEARPFLGCWRDNIETPPTNGTLAIWGGKLWEADGTSVGTYLTDTELHASGWNMLDPLSDWYTDQIFGCVYNLHSGDKGVVESQWDDRGNKFGGWWGGQLWDVDGNYWNMPNCYKNELCRFSAIDLQYGTVVSNNTGGGMLWFISDTADIGTPGYISSNLISGSLQNMQLTEGSLISYNTILGELIWGIAYTDGPIINNYVANGVSITMHAGIPRAGNTFYTNIDMTSSESEPPCIHTQSGQIILNLYSGYQINTVVKDTAVTLNHPSSVIVRRNGVATTTLSQWKVLFSGWYRIRIDGQFSAAVSTEVELSVSPVPQSARIISVGSSSKTPYIIEEHVFLTVFDDITLNCTHAYDPSIDLVTERLSVTIEYNN